jgi:NAD(P)-dependent dehydrogenase (short-subunit alcohol dehydrogenase family)
MTELRNKTALVTGASRGIGRATALALARAGAYVVVHYGRSAQEAESLVAEIRKADAQLRSRRIWDYRTALRFSPSRCAPSSAID